jgi:hypothetical protein
MPRSLRTLRGAGVGMLAQRNGQEEGRECRFPPLRLRSGQALEKAKDGVSEILNVEWRSTLVEGQPPPWEQLFQIARPPPFAKSVMDAAPLARVVSAGINSNGSATRREIHEQVLYPTDLECLSRIRYLPYLQKPIGYLACSTVALGSLYGDRQRQRYK